MTTPSSIVDAMLTAINAAVVDVDTVSASDFAPAIGTARIAALSPAFEVESRFQWETFDGSEVVAIHRLPIEFWVKHDGKPAATMQRARDIGASALAALVAADGTGYELVFDEPVSFSVDPGLTTINSLSWLVATMFVSVRDAIEYCGIKVEQALNTRWGEDTDEELKRYDDFKKWEGETQ